MARRWTLVAHPNYLQALRVAIQNPDERFRLAEAIWDKLEETDNPTLGATPNKDNQYELVLYGRVILYEIMEAEGKIRLLLLE